MSQRKGRPAERAVRAPEASVLALTRETCTMTVLKTSLRKSAKGRLCERFLQQEALVQKGTFSGTRGYDEALFGHHGMPSFMGHTNCSITCSPMSTCPSCRKPDRSATRSDRALSG